VSESGFTRNTFLSVTLSCFLGLSACRAWAVEAAGKTALPTIPASAKTPAGFVPKGWKIESSAQGDLNKDNHQDCAIVISETDPSSESKTATQRKLVIALHEADGLLHKSGESESAISLEGGAPELTIKKDVLIVEHKGSLQKGPKTIHKYQLRNGEWDLIGYTHVDYDSAAGHPAGSVDVNLLTGEVVGSSIAKQLASSRFLEVRSPAIEGPESCAADWTAPAAWLNTKSEQCPIVAVMSVHSKNTLFLRVELEGAYNISEDEVELLNAKGAVIPTLSKKKTAYGYILASYDLKSLEMSHGAGTADEQQSDDPELLRISVKVTPLHCGCKKTFSTAPNGDVGGILLTTLKGLPTLAEINVRDGAPVHPRLRPLTEQE
jgi:hypothetical protein